MKCSRCFCLFKDKYKYEVWVRMVKEMLWFFNGKGLIDEVSVGRIENDLNWEVFGVLGTTDDDEGDFDRFMEFIFSRSPILRRYLYLINIGKSNFENTYVSLVIRECNGVMLENLEMLLDKLRGMANRYKSLVQMGRTHGVHAEPISFGSKFASCWSDISRVFDRFYELKNSLEVVAVDHGAFFGSLDYEGLQEYLSKKLDLNYWNSNHNIIPQEKYLLFMLAINTLSQTLHKLSLDLHFLNQPEFSEVRFSEESKNSFEKIELASKNINYNCTAFSELLWSYSKCTSLTSKRRRYHLFETLKSFLGMLDEVNLILDGLEVLEENIEENMRISKTTIYSQAVMLYILKKGKFTREEVLEDMKILFSRVTDGTPGFYRELLNSPKYGDLFSNSVLDSIFSPKAYLNHIDGVYRRAFGENEALSMFPQEAWNVREVFYAIERMAADINTEYSGSISPVTLIAFSNRSLIFLGNLVTRLSFPVRVIILDSEEDDLAVKLFNLDNDSIVGSRVLMVDYLVSSGRNLRDFIIKFKSYVTVKDVMVCSLLKSKNPDTKQFQVDFWGLECEDKGEYFGFGMAVGSGLGFVHVPKIGYSS